MNDVIHDGGELEQDTPASELKRLLGARKYLYRAWIEEPEKEPKMIDEVLLLPEDEKYPMSIRATGIYVNPSYEWIWVMEFTGWKTDNDKNVYEGDIITFEQEGNFIIKWDVNNACFILLNMDKSYAGTFRYHNDYSAKVIGNIFENSELIESCT